MHSKGNELKIVGIKTKNGYLISDQPSSDYHSSHLADYFINGVKLKESFHKHWYKSDEEPIKIERKQSQSNINHRYILIDESLESDKFPLMFKREEVAYYDEDDCSWSWCGSYSHLRSLYKQIYDEQPEIMVGVDFSYETILELDEVKEFNGFSYPVQRTRYTSDGLTTVTNKDASNQLLDKILFPKPVLSMLPTKLSSDQFYKIIREHVKQNINNKAAQITSDYDFCFTVKKKIQLNTAIKHENETLKNNGRSYKNRKINVSYQNVRTIEIFEMTNASNKYKGYTPIPEITGTDVDDLKNKIDTYLSDLMGMINDPLKDCPHCEGLGVLEST